MKKRREKQKYKTHPIVKALLSLSLLLMAAVIAASWGFYRYVRAGEAKTAELCERCAYEAYVSLCENMVRGEGRAAADALCRLVLFSDCGEAEALRDVILSGRVDADIIDAVSLTGEGEVAERISAAIKRADSTAQGKRRFYTGEGVPCGGWETLSDMPEVERGEAHRIAASYLGGGVTLTEAENHGFPLVYTFMCKNAAVDVTRAGGRLLRLYVYRHGTAGACGPDECREAAEAFIKKAGIYDAELVSSARGEAGYDFAFCAAHETDGERVFCVDEVIKVGVAEAGGGIRFFDAGAYYEKRPRTYGGESIQVGRDVAARKVGVDKRALSLIRSGGELFWRFGGVKTLLIDAKNGEIRVQNP